MGSALAQFEGQKYLSIETYRKTGEPVRTPVWFVEIGGSLFVRTSEETGKYKRIRNNPQVKVAPCDFRGNVKGEWADANASVSQGPEADEALKLFKSKYGILYAATSLLARKRSYVILKIRAKDEPGTG